MTRSGVAYVCQSCGQVQAKWTGQCSGCTSWNTLVEESISRQRAAGHRGSLPQLKSHILNQMEETSQLYNRLLTHNEEFDRVCGGGLVPGSVILVGGDPGIGKSTLLLQVAASLSQRTPTLYVSGEESVEQVRLRAQRLGLGKSPLQLAASTSMNEIKTTLEGTPYAFVIIDSIQTMSMDELDSAAGTVSQVRAICNQLVYLAKTRKICILIVGHVTKEGTLAGPRVLEHMVDTVLYFEGENGHQFRILRAVKNRFGATDEIGVFEMSGQGLLAVQNPSSLFLSEQTSEISGMSVFAGMEGSRPLLVQIQALIAPATYGTPRRAVIGWDAGRLAMILAVLETRCYFNFGPRDIYLNVAGGLKISEPAADLAVAMALVSSLLDRPLPSEAIFFGEIALSGELRSVHHHELRCREAEKLGFKKAYMAHSKAYKSSFSSGGGLTLNPLRFLKEVCQNLGLHARKGQKNASIS